MSLVGPRPIVAREIELYYGKYAKKVFSVKPGLTGLWQISGRNDVENYHRRVALDLQYIRKAGIGLDISILLGTVRAVFGGGGAY